ncbi:hypothetical protein BDZ45DRAFT_671611, partial [Acephala macrosclerotiorum]
MSGYPQPGYGPPPGQYPPQGGYPPQQVCRQFFSLLLSVSPPNSPPVSSTTSTFLTCYFPELPPPHILLSSPSTSPL